MQKERKMFVTEMKRECAVKHVEVAFLDTPIDVCKERVRDRRNHPTLSGNSVLYFIHFLFFISLVADMGDEVIDSFLKGFKPPESWEGFTQMHGIMRDLFL